MLPRKDYMSKDEIFEVIKKVIVNVVPELAEKSISMQDSLRELGANSIDRAEILISSMSELKVKVPMIEFAQAKNLEELTTIFYNKLSS